MGISRRDFLKVGVTAGLAAMQPGLGALAQSAEPKPVAEGGKRNLLFIMSDQHRGDAMSCENHPMVETPVMDQLAREGARFSHTYCQSPLCVPSRACMMTGRYVHLNRCYTNACRLPEDEYTWAEFLNEKGYNTVAVGKTHGIDDGLALYPVDKTGTYPAGATAYNNKKHGLVYGTNPLPPEEFYDARIADGAIKLLKELKTRRAPWALFVGIFSPHPPLWPPKPYDTMYSPEAIELPPFKLSDFESRPNWQERTYQGRFSAYTDEDKRNIIAKYYGLVTYIDTQIGRILGTLDELGMAGNTAVIYTADHGDNMGEHGLFAKFASMYEGEVRVPGIVRLPGVIREGAVVDTPIEGIDLTTTALRLLEHEPPEQMLGRDLIPLVNGKAEAGRPFVYSAIARGEERGMMLRTEEWKLCHYTDQAGELYNLKKDPGEIVNLYGAASLRSVRDDLTYKLLGHMARSQDSPHQMTRTEPQPAEQAGAGRTR